MNKNEFNIPVIKYKKLFEKQLQKITGFSEANKSMGIDSKAIVYIPEHQILAVAAIHEEDEKEQGLTLYKIEATIDKNCNNRFTNKRGSSFMGVQQINKKRNSSIYPFSGTSLLEKMVVDKSKEKEKCDKKNNKKKEKLKTSSGQSLNVGKNKKFDINDIILEADEHSKSKTLKEKV